nr:MFS transporter [Pseudopedobacter sp.]
MKRILLIVVLAQFLCTSLWFAGNAVLSDLVKGIDTSSGFLAQLTSAVQLGFIFGTLVFAIFTISDRFSPSKVFFICAVIAALCNLGLSMSDDSTFTLLLFRFLTGFFLAGIYPVGMKIASDYFEKGLGKSLGFLVGALVLGTAFPHLLKSASFSFSWKYVIYITSSLALVGGGLIFLLVPDGPFRKQGQKLKWSSFFTSFRNQDFKAAAFGYFGHMWELYTFWAFVPLMLMQYQQYHKLEIFTVSLFSFLIIASGSIACILGGFLSQSFGVKKIATLALSLSGLCCILSPLAFLYTNLSVFISFLFFWGMVVVADSPLFSTLVAQNAPQETRGTSLTIVNCIGFTITIISIQSLQLVSAFILQPYGYMVLAFGPMLGLLALIHKTKKVLPKRKTL